MLTITDGGSLSRALNTLLNPQLKRLLTDRVQQLDVENLTIAARVVIVQPGDTITDLDKALGFSVFMNAGDGTRYGDPDFTPGWEWIEDHGHAYELVFIFTDDGFAHVIMVENGAGMDPQLIQFCADYCTVEA